MVHPVTPSLASTQRLQWNCQSFCRIANSMRIKSLIIDQSYLEALSDFIQNRGHLAGDQAQHLVQIDFSSSCVWASRGKRVTRVHVPSISTSLTMVASSSFVGVGPSDRNTVSSSSTERRPKSYVIHRGGELPSLSLSKSLKASVNKSTCSLLRECFNSVVIVAVLAIVCEQNVKNHVHSLLWTQIKSGHRWTLIAFTTK